MQSRGSNVTPIFPRTAAALIDYKRAVVDSVTDGTASGEAAVVDRLLRELAADARPIAA